MSKQPQPIEKLFKPGEFSIDVTRLMLNSLPLERVKVACGINRYMHKQVCDDSFWILYYERMFLGPKPKFEERDLKKLKNKITKLFYYLLKHNKEKYAIIIYKKYKDYIDINGSYNYPIKISLSKGYSELLELLLKDPRLNREAYEFEKELLEDLESDINETKEAEIEFTRQLLSSSGRNVSYIEDIIKKYY